MRPCSLVEPPISSLVWIRLSCQPATMESLEAKSLAISVDPSGRKLVRLQFTRWVSLDPILKHHQDRRLWQRFAVRETRAKLTWLEGGSEKTVWGELTNVCGGGAAMIFDSAIPPADEPIWFELETGSTTLDPVESGLVVASLDPSGTRIARIKFIDQCPMLLFEAAIKDST